MKPSDFRNRLNEIVSRLDVKGILEFLSFLPTNQERPFDEASKKRFSTLLFVAREQLHDLEKDDDTKIMIEGLELNKVLDRSTLGDMIAAVKAVGSANYLRSQQPNALPAMHALYASLQNLQRLTEVTNRLLMHEIPSEKNDSILQIRVLDYDDGGIDADRYSTIFAQLKELADLISTVFSGPATKARVLFIETGSEEDVYVAFGKGMGEAAANFLAQIWTSIIYRKQEKQAKNADAVLKTVDAIAKIEENVTAGNMTREVGEGLKHRLIKCAEKLFDSGAAPPSVLTSQSIDPRQLLEEHRTIKLLGSGSKSDESPTDGKQE
jgi:hypothetical protein